MFGDAESYERYMGRWSRLLAPRFVEFAELPAQGRMLDVGSGTGSLTFAIAARHPRAYVTGIDPSPEYVAYAASGNSSSDRVSFEVGDAEHLRFSMASFDAALSCLVFNFIPDPKAALREFRRVTKPGGTVAVAVWDYGDGMRMLRHFWDAAARVEPSAGELHEAHMRFCRSGVLPALWREAGLEQVSEQPIEITMRFASLADYWDPFLLGQGPAGAFLRHLDSDQLQAVRSEVMHRLSLAAEDMPFDLPARAWAVRGTVPDRG